MSHGSELLRQWRESRGLSQEKAAEIFGVTAPSVCEWESRKKTPKGNTLICIEARTDGAVPIESWSDDPDIAEAMRAVLSRRARLPRRRRAA